MSFRRVPAVGSRLGLAERCGHNGPNHLSYTTIIIIISWNTEAATTAIHIRHRWSEISRTPSLIGPLPLKRRFVRFAVCRTYAEPLFISPTAWTTTFFAFHWFQTRPCLTCVYVRSRTDFVTRHSRALISPDSAPRHVVKPSREVHTRVLYFSARSRAKRWRLIGTRRESYKTLVPEHVFSVIFPHRRGVVLKFRISIDTRPRKSCNFWRESSPVRFFFFNYSWIASKRYSIIGKDVTRPRRHTRGSRVSNMCTVCITSWITHWRWPV